jgi:hypothetical protein
MKLYCFTVRFAFESLILRTAFRRIRKTDYSGRSLQNVGMEHTIVCCRPLTYVALGPESQNRHCREWVLDGPINSVPGCGAGC